MTKSLLLVKPPEKSELNFGAFSLAVLGAAVQDMADISILDATDLPLGAIVYDTPVLDGITTLRLRLQVLEADWYPRWRVQENPFDIHIVGTARARVPPGARGPGAKTAVSARYRTPPPRPNQSRPRSSLATG